MKVYIGEWPNSIDLDNFIPLPKEHPLKEKISDFLYNTFLGNIVRWYNSRNRKIVVKDITSSDTYSLDATLAEIILPCLKRFKEDLGKNGGYPAILEGECDDIPENLKTANGTTKWNYILDEMIYSFEQVLDDSDSEKYYNWNDCDFEDVNKFLENIDKIEVDREGLTKYQNRVQNGLELFGKYFQNL